MPKGIKGFQKGHTINLNKDVSIETRKKISKSNIKKNASKESVHEWVVRWKGKASFCEDCKTTEKKYFDWSNVDHKYRRKLEDYKSRCRPCHRQYDIKFNGYKYRQGKKIKLEGKILSVQEWSKLLGIKIPTINYRIRAGKPIKEVLKN